MSEVRLVEMPDRFNTFAVHSDNDVVVGYVRFDEDGDVVARTLGDRHNAAEVRRFTSTSLASRWLLREHPAH